MQGNHGAERESQGANTYKSKNGHEQQISNPESSFSRIWSVWIWRSGPARCRERAYAMKSGCRTNPIFPKVCEFSYAQFGLGSVSGTELAVWEAGTLLATSRNPPTSKCFEKSICVFWKHFTAKNNHFFPFFLSPLGTTGPVPCQSMEDSVYIPQAPHPRSEPRRTLWRHVDSPAFHSCLLLAPL